MSSYYMHICPVRGAAHCWGRERRAPQPASEATAAPGPTGRATAVALGPQPTLYLGALPAWSSRAQDKKSFVLG